MVLFTIHLSHHQGSDFSFFHFSPFTFHALKYCRVSLHSLSDFFTPETADTPQVLSWHQNLKTTAHRYRYNSRENRTPHAPINPESLVKLRWYHPTLSDPHRAGVIKCLAADSRAVLAGYLHGGRKECS